MMRMMIVDDEELIRLGLEKILSKMNMEVTVIGSYGNGVEALSHLSKLQGDEIDLLLTDIKMPRMDGLKLIERVRERMPNLTIAVLSGFNDFEYARTALRFGVSEYLLKPIDKKELDSLLRKAAQVKDGQDIRNTVVRSGTDSDNYLVEQIKKILEKEYDAMFELERLAEQIGRNASYISRLFKNKTDMTITDYLIKIRMEKATQFLVDHPHYKNYEISQLVGYSDPAYFNKLFKRIVGVTPKEYRDKHI